MNRVFFHPPGGWGSGKCGQKKALQGTTKHFKQRFLLLGEFTRLKRISEPTQQPTGWKDYRAMGRKEGADHEAKFMEQGDSRDLPNSSSLPSPSKGQDLPYEEFLTLPCASPSRSVWIKP